MSSENAWSPAELVWKVPVISESPYLYSVRLSIRGQTLDEILETVRLYVGTTPVLCYTMKFTIGEPSVTILTWYDPTKMDDALTSYMEDDSFVKLNFDMQSVCHVNPFIKSLAHVSDIMFFMNDGFEFPNDSAKRQCDQIRDYCRCRMQHIV